MSRRGSIREEANGTWSLVVDVPGGAGRRRQLRRRGFTTRREAQAALVELLATLQRGTFVRPEKVRLGEYLVAWMDALETSGRSPATVSSYRHTLRLHVVPYLGDVQLQALAAVDLDRLYRRLLESGRRNGAGGGLSRRTVRYVHVIVSAALSDAVAKGLLSRNPAAAATPPAAAATRAPEMAWWRPEELQAFLSFVEDHELAPLFRLAAVTGMRRGELVGLSWIDVDLEAGKLTVRRQLTAVDYQVRWQSPKSERGRRTIDLDPATVEALARLEGDRSRRPAHGSPTADLVFAQPDGSPLHPDRVSAVFDGLVARSGLRRIRLHDLRHTHAAHLIAAGVDSLTISRRLGHASVSFTLDRYGHLMPDAGANAATAVAALLAAATPDRQPSAVVELEPPSEPRPPCPPE